MTDHGPYDDGRHVIRHAHGGPSHDHPLTADPRCVTCGNDRLHCRHSFEVFVGTTEPLHEHFVTDVADLRAALRRAYHDLLAYGQHMTGEITVRLWDDEKALGHRRPGEPCKCGLDAALIAAEKALKGTTDV